MEDEIMIKKSSVVRVFTALIFILGAFYCYVVVGSLPRLLRNPWENLNPWVNLSLWLDSVFTGLIFLIILYQLFRLVKMITKGDPFNQENPRRIRNVAYGVFGISISNLVFTGLRSFLTPWQSVWSDIANILLRGAERIFFILGLLIIAKLLDTGVRLQQDQNLTV
jgi:hypothetical protein